MHSEQLSPNAGLSAIHYPASVILIEKDFHGPSMTACKRTLGDPVGDYARSFTILAMTIIGRK
jgi:hypothetical protein